MIEKKASIYYLIDQYDRIGYVGKADDMDKRMISHKHASINNKRYVYCWIRSVGFDNIKMVLIEECDFSIWRERERFWIAEYKKNSKLTNLTNGGDGVDGLKFSEESIKKMSESHKGKIQTNEAKKKLSIYNIENNMSKYMNTEEAKIKSAKSRIGLKKSDETKIKMSGKTPWNKGKKGLYVYSEETSQKISKKLKGRVSPMKGKTKSEESKNKTKNSMILYHKNKKNIAT